MKKLILISFCIVFYFSSFSQEKYSHKEIAEMLGIQESTSRSQLVKARRILQKKVEELAAIKTLFFKSRFSINYMKYNVIIIPIVYKNNKAAYYPNKYTAQTHQSTQSINHP